MPTKSGKRRAGEGADTSTPQSTSQKRQKKSSSAPTAANLAHVTPLGKLANSSVRGTSSQVRRNRQANTATKAGSKRRDAASAGPPSITPKRKRSSQCPQKASTIGPETGDPNDSNNTAFVAASDEPSAAPLGDGTAITSPASSSMTLGVPPQAPSGTFNLALQYYQPHNTPPSSMPPHHNADHYGLTVVHGSCSSCLQSILPSDQKTDGQVRWEEFKRAKAKGSHWTPPPIYPAVGYYLPPTQVPSVYPFVGSSYPPPPPPPPLVPSMASDLGWLMALNEMQTRALMDQAPSMTQDVAQPSRIPAPLPITSDCSTSTPWSLDLLADEDRMAQFLNMPSWESVNLAQP